MSSNKSVTINKKQIPEQKLNKETDGFVIRPLLKEIDKRKLNEQPHRHRFHEIIFLESGSGQHYIDDQKIKLTNRSFYLITQNQVHGFEYGHQLKGFLIRFNDNFLPVQNENYNVLRNYEFLAAQKNILNLNEAECIRFKTQLQTIHAQFSENIPGKLVTIQYLLLALLNELILKIKLEQQSDIDSIRDKDQKIFHRFVHLLNEHFMTEHELDFYAGRLRISKRKLSAISTRYFGEPAKTVLLKRLIEEAKRYLRYSGLSAKEIAFRLQFDDPAYLSRLFRKYTGVTMSAFRRSD